MQVNDYQQHKDAWFELFELGCRPAASPPPGAIAPIAPVQP
ncbi:MAG TPA: hypothetical protein VIZ64_06540 [Dokdonella sp.]